MKTRDDSEIRLCGDDFKEELREQEVASSVNLYTIKDFDTWVRYFYWMQGKNIWISVIIIDSDVTIVEFSDDA